MEPVEETRDRPVSLEWVIGLSNFRPNFDGFSEHVTFQGAYNSCQNGPFCGFLGFFPNWIADKVIKGEFKLKVRFCVILFTQNLNPKKYAPNSFKLTLFFAKIYFQNKYISKPFIFGTFQRHAFDIM